MLGVLASFARTTEADLAAIPTATLVVSGEADHDDGSPQRLAAVLPGGRAVIVRGDHMTAVGDPSLTAAIVDFLA
jgi:hypothetical protein